MISSIPKYPKSPLPSRWGLGLQHMDFGRTHLVSNTLKRKARCGSSPARDHPRSFSRALMSSIINLHTEGRLQSAALS